MASSSGNANQSVLNLPLGYKFFPSDEVLLYYLKMKNLGLRKLSVDMNPRIYVNAIPTIDSLYTLNPQQIPFDKFEKGVEGEWIFFTTRPSTDLVTRDGYWHPTTLPTEIKSGNNSIGFKQIFTFHWGKAPNGEKSNFLIHEYKLNTTEVQNFVACRVRNVEAFTRDREDSEDED